MTHHSHYLVPCERCGAVTESRERQGQCRECGQLFEVVWPDDGRGKAN